MRFVSALTLALAAATTAVVDAAHLERRQGTASLGNVTCGSNSYSKSQVDEAVAEGCRLFAAGEQVGSNKYPHRFNNREGLSFATSGPYQEFPILESGVYTGRAPGPDRVVFDPDYQGACVYVGTMTHTDAPTRNGFVLCDEMPARSEPRPSAQPSSSTTAAPGPSETASAPGSGAPRTALGYGVAAGVVLGWLVL